MILIKKIRKIAPKTLLLLALSLTLLISNPIMVAGQNTATSSANLTDLEKQIADLQSKISDTKNQERTLSQQIAYIDNQIKLTELKINETTNNIAQLATDIDTMSKRLASLQNQVDSLTNISDQRIRLIHEQSFVNPVAELLLNNNGIDNMIMRNQYLAKIRENDLRVLEQLQNTKTNYDDQKQQLANKQKQEQDLKTKSIAQKSNLNDQIKAKDKLLKDTKNSEAVYQLNLAQAKAEYESIQNILAGKGTEGEIGLVNQGDVIAKIIQGPSCNSSGTHLHFTVSNSGTAYNPFSYLKSIDYTNDSGGDTFNPSGGWEWPVTPPINFFQGYGVTWYVMNYHPYPFHNGIDIYGASDSVLAVKNGTLFQGSYSGNGGCKLRYVRVHHSDNGLDTFYLHINYVH